MKKLILSLLAFIIITPIAFASGKLITMENKNVVLQATSNIPSAKYKWTLLNNNEIINNQESKSFTYLFETIWTYDLNLVVFSDVVNTVETSNVKIIVGKKESFKESLQLNTAFLPKKNNNILWISKPSNSVSFILNKSTGNIVNYKIDTNINIDSDGDDITDNDIDNIDDLSYTTGSLWTYSYKSSELPTKTKITIIDDVKKTKEEIIDIKQITTPKNNKLKAILDIYPNVSDDKLIHLSDENATIFLSSNRSQGDISEYWIDTNINDDSNDNKIPNDDIDNKDHPSFLNGEVFPLTLKRVHWDREIMLSVISSTGKGSRLKKAKKIVWDATTPQSKNIYIFSDKEEIFIGEKVFFGIEWLNSRKKYEIKWDFDADKKTDLTSNKYFASFKYDTIGEYDVLVQIDNEWIIQFANKKITVKEKINNEYLTNTPISNFDIKQNDNKISIFNTSIIDPSINEEDVEYKWQLGNGEESYKQHPVFIYNEIGRYVVRLTVSDNSGQSHVRQILISITKINPDLNYDNELKDEINAARIIAESEVIEEPKITEEPEVIEEPEITEEDSETWLLWFMFFWIIIIISGIIVIIGIYLIILKIKNPDYTFREIIEMEKERAMLIIEGRASEIEEEIIDTETKIEKVIDTKFQNEKTEEKKAEPKKEEIKTEKPIAINIDNSVNNDISKSQSDTSKQNTIKQDNQLSNKSTNKKEQNTQNTSKQQTQQWVSSESITKTPPPPPSKTEDENIAQDEDELPDWLK